MRKLPDSEFLSECFVYSKETGELHWKRRPLSHFTSLRDQLAWNGRNAGKKVTSVGSDGYIRVSILYGLDKQRWPAHRIIFKMQTGRDPVDEIDHKNCVRTDNRWSNLREATHSQNHCNKRHRTNKHGLKGVHRWSQGGLTYFASSINVNKKRISLGYFKTPQEAHAAYVAAAKTLHAAFVSKEISSAGM